MDADETGAETTTDRPTPGAKKQNSKCTQCFGPPGGSALSPKAQTTETETLLLVDTSLVKTVNLLPTAEEFSVARRSLVHSRRCGLIPAIGGLFWGVHVNHRLARGCNCDDMPVTISGTLLQVFAQGILLQEKITSS